MKVVSNLKRPTPKGLNNNDPGCNPGDIGSGSREKSPEVRKSGSREENTNTSREVRKEERKYLVWDSPNPEGVESSYPRVQPGAEGRRQKAG